MGRDKRKTRLDKGGAAGAADFVGFDAFAATTATPSSSTSSLKPSPVYTGSDSQLSLVFKRISQKRDAVTKARALNELQSYFQQNDCNRKDQAEALSHLVFVYHSKINYDDSSLVRAAAISCMNAACKRLPKAWKALVVEQQQSEVCGELWCARADPAAEVRLEATAASFDQEDGTSPKGGIVSYVTRILGYGRPGAMHDALFARKQTADPPDRDELDERFERIVGTALGGMNLWIQAHPETGDCQYADNFDGGILWSTLNSSKSSLRRQTYSLLATLCQHGKSLVFGQAGLSTLPKLFTNALTEEKEAANIPSLLEVLLLYLSNFPNGDPWNAVDASALVKGLGKQMKKACHGASASRWAPTMLPLLAFIADDTFALQLQLLKNMSTGIEAAIGPGDSLLIAAAIAECSSFFLLRNETGTVQMDANIAKQFADFWCQMLKKYISFESLAMARGADDSLLHALVESFCKMDESCYNRTHSAIYRIRDWFWCEAVESSVLDIKGETADRRWAGLLNSAMVKRKSSEMQESHADPVVHKRFRATLCNCQDESSSLPDAPAYDLMIASVCYSGARYVFSADDGSDEIAVLEKFLLNDLLRWMVMDTSSLTLRKDQSTLVALSFALLRDCLLSITSPHKQKIIWETILREMIAAKCDLELLSEGLAVLEEESIKSESSGDWKEILRCKTLDSFSVDVGQEAVARYQSHFLGEPVDDVDDERYREEARKALLFLETCVGLNRISSIILVSRTVVHHWVEAIMPAEGEHVLELGGDDGIQDPLFLTLLSLVSRGHDSLLSPDDVERILLESWRRGGRQWNDNSVPLILSKQAPGSQERNVCLSEKIIKSGTAELHNLIDSFCLTSDTDLCHVALVCHVWSERAFRILRLCFEAGEASDGDDIPPPSLALVGLADEEMWKSALLGTISISHLYLCFVYTLQQFDAVSDRLSVLEGHSDSSSALLSNILLGISDASDGLIIDPVTRRDRKCEFVLSLLGGNSTPRNLLQTWCRDVINGLSASKRTKFGSEGHGGRVAKGVSVLSEVMFAMFGKVGPDEPLNAPVSDVVDAIEVHEGDELFYVTDEGLAREKAHVVKVHSDDYPRLYFTIRLEKSDGVQERQTVVERLRRLSQPPDPDPSGAIILASLSENEKEERAKIGDMIFEDAVKPVLPGQEETPIGEAAAECLNIIISHCGLPGKEGIGGTRYEVFKLLSSIQSNVVQSFISKDGATDSAVVSLRILALAMGLGNTAPASRYNFNLTKLIPDESITALLQHFNDREIERDEGNRIERATLEWLTVAVGEISDQMVCMDAVGLLYKLAMPLLVQDGNVARRKLADVVLVMRAVQNAQLAGSTDEDARTLVEDDEKAVLTEVVRAFSYDLQGGTDDVCHYQILDTRLRTDVKLPEWYHPFRSLVETSLKHQPGLVAAAARSNCNKLVENLFSTNKRWLAFRLLNASTEGSPLHDDYFTGDMTQRRLGEWQRELIEEEAEELEDDVGLVGQWIPESMMNELESWEEIEVLDSSDEVLDSSDEVLEMGRMLCWLSFLSFVDSAATVDVAFRGSVSAYLEFVNVKSVLDTTLSCLNLVKNRNPKQIVVIAMQDVLNDASCLIPSDIAALVMFRTVEVFPTHFKHWWEDDCPKDKREAVSQFVETKIAPEALRRELLRINSATDLGDMTVSGSTVSREVTATYTQDECQLSLVIQVPATFPLRNVEVDGRRTLGIPEKRWKRWALQIQQMLNNQDGTLLDALMLWKENVDKDFAGLEPCPVCYSILSVKTHELPNLECNTCNNRFHSSCLYKWFHSSGKSQCVLCQQPWSGTRVQKGG